VATLAQLYTRIILDTNRDDMGSGGDLEQAKIDAVADAIEKHADEEFWFNRASGSGTTTAADATMTMPTGIRVPNVVAYLGCELQQVPLDAIEHRTETGAPSKWAENEGAIQIWPIPDATYTVYVYGLATAEAPASGSSNIWTVEAYRLILSTAKRYLYGGALRDPEGAQLAAIDEMEALTKLRRETRRRGRANLVTDIPPPRHSFNIFTG
jgi:hypothetical protein